MARRPGRPGTEKEDTWIQASGAAKRVFLTGHTGFKGSWLSLWLQSMEADVQGYSLAPNTEPSLFVEADIATGMRSTLGDIRDLDALQKCMNAFKPDIVLHLAAQPLVRLSYEEPVATYATNVMGTVHVLEASRHADSVRAIVNVTTDKCYENREWVWGYREDEPMGGHDPYSNSKGLQRARDLGVPQVVLPRLARRRARIGTRRQRHRRR